MQPASAAKIQPDISLLGKDAAIPRNAAWTFIKYSNSQPNSNEI